MKWFKKKKRNTLDVTILREYRLEARRRLDFIGGWSGHWTTTIDGVSYRSERVSSFRYCVYGEYGCGHFLRNAIIDRIQLRRDPEKMKDYANAPAFDRERWIETEFEKSI